MAAWCAQRLQELLEVGYGSDGHHPQFAALHLDTGYLRMVYGEDSVWGTSISLMPCLWSGGRYFQGAPIEADWRTVNGQMQIDLSGTIAGLEVNGQVCLRPPDPNKRILEAAVEMEVTGSVELDDRPGEAFKPVMLSSMHIAGRDLWDTCGAVAGSVRAEIPSRGWIFNPPVEADRLSLIGGTSKWKRNGPTVTVVLDREMSITGWVDRDSNPNDDNVTLWAANSTVLPNWRYSVSAAFADI